MERRRDFVRRRTRNGYVYFYFWLKPSRTVAWKQISVTKRMLEAYGIKPSGPHGEITEDDAVRARVLYERDYFKAPALVSTVVHDAGKVSTLFEGFIASRCADNLESVRKRKQCVFDHFVKHFNDPIAKDVTDKDVAKYKDLLAKRGVGAKGTPLTNNTLRDYLMYFRAAYTYGQHAGLVDRNPFAVVKLPPRVDTNTCVWTPEMLKTVVLNEMSSAFSDRVKTG